MRDLTELEQEKYEELILWINRLVNPEHQEQIICKVDDLVDELLEGEE